MFLSYGELNNVSPQFLILTCVLKYGAQCKNLWVAMETKTRDQNNVKIQVKNKCGRTLLCPGPLPFF